MRPRGIDLFADRDLRFVAETTKLDPETYPRGIHEAVQIAPNGAWMYVGAIENQPDLVDRLAAERPLLGNAGHVLRQVRSPSVVQTWMTAEGLLFPEVRESPPTDSSAPWLDKPLASGGGVGVERWRPSETSTSEDGPRYFQRLVPGKPASAIFLGDGSSATFLGATEQLIGSAESPFEYLGNLGPLQFSEAQSRQVTRMGTALTERAKLVGLFGLDLILDDQRVWLIEINPRYTASVELLEWSQGRSFLALHRAIFDRAHATNTPSWKPLAGILGKAILRASEDCTFPVRLSERRLANAARRFPTIADVPDPRAKIRRGEPIMTVYARGKTARECRERLQGRIERWTRRVTGSSDMRSGR